MTRRCARNGARCWMMGRIRLNWFVTRIWYKQAAHDGWAARISKLHHGGEQPLDVLRTRKPVVPIFHQGEDHVILRKSRGQLDGVLTGDIGILNSLQDTHWAAGLDHAPKQEVTASVFDQVARDQVSPLGIR